MPSKYAPLNASQEAALRTYAAAHVAGGGHDWKDALRADWLAARVPGLLHQLRNSHGPTWLAGYQLADPAADTKKRTRT